MGRKPINKSGESQTIGVRFPDDLIERLQRAADAKGMSLSAYIRKAVKDAIANDELAGIQLGITPLAAGLLNKESHRYDNAALAARLSAIESQLEPLRTVLMELASKGLLPTQAGKPEVDVLGNSLRDAVLDQEDED